MNSDMLLFGMLLGNEIVAERFVNIEEIGQCQRYPDRFLRALTNLQVAGGMYPGQAILIIAQRNRTAPTMGAWGGNDDSQSSVPAGLSDVSAIAGGSNFSLAIIRDKTGPSQTPVKNDAGWNTNDVTVNWNWSDSSTGLDPDHCTTSSTSRGAGSVTPTATCQDLAGNSSTASYSVTVDKTAPP